MTTEILFNSEGRKKVLSGINKISDAVKVTLGAKGRNVIISKPYYPVKITKDGVTVANSIELKDEIENIGATLIKEVASKTVYISGDGTTTATVLAQAIINAGIKAVESGANPMDLKKGIEKATSDVVKYLKSVSKTVDTNEILKQIATVSANGDTEIGELIATAFSKVGKDGVIKVQESKGHSTTMDIVEGMKLERGYLSHHFITNSERQIIEMENPYILLYDGKITMMKDLLTTLEHVSQSGRSLLIIAEDLEGEALATLVVNKLQGRLRVCAVKSPEFGDNTKLVMEDIAVLTGATFISEQTGIRLEQSTIEMLGSATTVTIDKDSCLIVGGKGDKVNIESRANSIKNNIELNQNDHEKEKLKTRLAKLKDGIAVLSIGGITETEIKEKTDRVDDALCATRSASEEGFVVGGGATYLSAIKNISVITENDDEKIGVSILLKSLEYPFRQILSNGGVEASSYIKEVSEGEYGIGYNVKNNKIENLFKSGVIDPTKVLRVAIENASSIASIFLTTECIISENKQQDGK
jgi:chaperonin GroEL